MSDRPFTLIENYIYLYHVDKFILLPSYPETIQDQLSASFTQTNALARSAPIFTYSNSGPRTVQVSLTLHREMMSQINYTASNLNLNNLSELDEDQLGIEVGDDYVDFLIKQIQAIALPKYSTGIKMVNPPLVALRFGNDIYIKGVVNGGVTVTYSGPILQNDKYAVAEISFSISEIDPYDADSIWNQGSFRGLNTSLERRIWRK